ncbi:head-tail connector protein [Sphingosinicella xenopeptidilytica]|uniref:Head-tail connector protein n=1 Tax=Sphingosinicella xenopeptidilytica TaxID=364098 RepID=A0ABW3BX97_SPHXN
MSAPLAVSLGEVKAYLRIDGAEEDALLAGLVRTAAALCEAFTGQVLIAEARSETVAADGEWHRLAATPVRSFEGAFVGEDAAAFDSLTDASGDGWVRISGGRAARVAVEAGLAEDWNGVPEPLRQGIVRLTAHLYANRDAAGDAGPPAAVAALWRPWRRMRLA